MQPNKRMQSAKCPLRAHFAADARRYVSEVNVRYRSSTLS